VTEASVETATRRFAVLLEAVGIPYRVTGSVAGICHGFPRGTQDIDILIDPTPASLDAFLNQLPEDRFYVSREAAHAALNQSGMFNVIEFDGGWKADLIVPRRRPFSRSEFDRRSTWDVDGRSVDVVTAEDLVLAKLEWARDGGSDRQLEDAAAILRVRRDELDHAYLELWVAELGVTEQWVAVQ